MPRKTKAELISRCGQLMARCADLERERDSIQRELDHSELERRVVSRDYKHDELIYTGEKKALSLIIKLMLDKMARG